MLATYERLLNQYDALKLIMGRLALNDVAAPNKEATSLARLPPKISLHAELIHLSERVCRWVIAWPVGSEGCQFDALDFL